MSATATPVTASAITTMATMISKTRAARASAAARFRAAILGAACAGGPAPAVIGPDGKSEGLGIDVEPGIMLPPHLTPSIRTRPLWERLFLPAAAKPKTADGSGVT